MNKTKPFIALVLTAFMAAGCQETLEDRCEREAREYTEKHCPTAVAPGIVMDSMTFEKPSQTVSYYYTLTGKLDTAATFNEKSRQLLLDQIKNSANLRLYKEAGYSFRYVYHSKKNKGLQLYETLFKQKDYQ